MAHHGKEFGFRLISGFSLLPRLVVGFDLLLQPFSLLIHQVLQVVAVLPKLLFVAVPHPFQFQLFDGLLAEDFDGPLHAGDLILAPRPHRMVQLTAHQRRHSAGEPVEAAGDAAAHIEPQHRQRQHKAGSRSEAVAQLRLLHVQCGIMAGPDCPGLRLIGHGGGFVAKTQRGVLQFLLEGGYAVFGGEDPVTQHKETCIRVRDTLQLRSVAFGLLAPPRVANGFDPARDDPQAADKRSFDFPQLDFVASVFNPVDQQPDFRCLRPQLEHQAQLEQVDLNQLVKSVRAGLFLYWRCTGAVKARDHRGGTHLGIGHQSIRHAQKTACSRQVAFGELFELLAQRNTVLNQAVEKGEHAGRIRHSRPQPRRPHSPSLLQRVKPAGQGVYLVREKAGTVLPFGLRGYGGQFGGNCDDAGALFGHATHLCYGGNCLADHLCLAACKCSELDQAKDAGKGRKTRNDYECEAQFTAETELS